MPVQITVQALIWRSRPQMSQEPKEAIANPTPTRGLVLIPVRDNWPISSIENVAARPPGPQVTDLPSRRYNP